MEPQLDLGFTSLGEFLRSRQAALVSIWSEQAHRPSTAELDEHRRELLASLAVALTSQVDAPPVHTLDRLAGGFELRDIVEEYTVLRHAILDLWEKEVGGTIDTREVRRLNLAIDDAIEGASARFASARQLADNIAQLAWMADETGYVFWYNKRWFEYTGTTLEEVQGWGWQKVHDPKHRQRVVETYSRAVQRGEDWEDTFPLRAKDGSYRWFLSHAIAIKDSSGRVVRWFGTNTDITEQRETELKLRAAEARLRLAIEAMPLGTWDLNMVTGEAQWSHDMKQIFGVDFQPPVGWSLRIIHPDDRAAVEAAMARSNDPNGDGLFALEYRIRLASSGELRWVTSRGRTFFDERGRPARMVGTTLDVSERKRAEIASKFLSDATAVLASSLDYVDNLEEVCRLAVPRLADWAAVTLVEPDGKLTDVGVASSEPTQTKMVRGMLRQYLRDPDAAQGIEAVIRGGGHSHLVLPMVARGRLLGALMLASAEGGGKLDDVVLETARHLARRAALAVDNARLYEDARAATRLREQVLAVVSHDLKSPLSAIQFAAELLEQRLPESSDPGIQRQLDTITRVTGRMNHLIGDLLDVASLQAGRLSVDPRNAPVGKLLDEAVASHEASAGQKGVILRSEGQAIDAVVRADPDRVLQVLANLIGNAIKFCEDGDSIVVAAKPKGDDVIISVRDTGSGMSAEEIAHLFEPYWSAARHATKGTGLGLYISRGIIDAHGGRIWAESLVGVGSTFYFTLPAASV